MGDVFLNNAYPFTGLSAGGCINDCIAAQRLILDTINADPQIVPGHLKLETILDLKENKNLHLRLCKTIQAQIDRQRDREQIINNTTITQQYDQLGHDDRSINTNCMQKTIDNSLISLLASN